MDSLHLMDLKIESPIFQDWLHNGEQSISISELNCPLTENPNPLSEFFQLPSYHSLLTPNSQHHGFDNCEVDFLMWCNNFPSVGKDGIIDAVPLNINTDYGHGNDGIGIKFNDKSIEVDEESASWGCVSRDGEKGRHEKCNGRLRSSNSIEFDEIKRYFYVPITRAAKELNVGLTVLKKRCRELGISRWPNRKMNSLRSLIHNVKRIGDNGEKIERLEELKRILEREPEMELTEETKKLRQACFKANYKRRIMEAAAT